MNLTPILSLLLTIFTTSQAYALDPVDFVDVNKYTGTWYQIARNPLFFEAGCVCSQQKLSLNSDGTVAVYNSCNDGSPTGALREISGVAISQDPVSNARFTVDFGLPHKGEYWVIGLVADYQYAVVSDPSKKSLYILSKSPVLDPALYKEAVDLASKQVDVTQLQMTLQTGCTYP